MRGNRWILGTLLLLALGGIAEVRAGEEVDHEIGREGNPNPFRGELADLSLWEQVQEFWDEADRPAAQAAFKRFNFNPPENFLLPKDAEDREDAFQKLIERVKDRRAFFKVLSKTLGLDDRWSYQVARVEAESMSDEEIVAQLDYVRDFMKRIGNPSEENMYGFRMGLAAYSAALRGRLGPAIEAFAPKGAWDSNHLRDTYLAGKLLVTGKKFEATLAKWATDGKLSPKSLEYRKARALVVQAEYFWKEALFAALPEYSADKARSLTGRFAASLTGGEGLARLPVPASTSERALPEGIQDQTTLIQSVLEDGKVSAGDHTITFKDSGKKIRLESVDIYGNLFPEEVGFIVCEYGNCHNGAMDSTVRTAELNGSPVELIGRTSEIPEAAENLRKKGVKRLVYAGHGDKKKGVSVDGQFGRLNAENLDTLAPYVADFEMVFFNACSLGACKEFTDNFSLMSGVPAIFNDHDLYHSTGEPVQADKESSWVITTPAGQSRPDLLRERRGLDEVLTSARKGLERQPWYWPLRYKLEQKFPFLHQTEQR